ncbi:hypothetical protein B0T16DRAFT_333538 [Cercophora newfieldiana]|uniref:Uncharacterized protein n=1 Tax=Cercophora newfieldiana TaxID=92897 RepID=A0AA39Y4D0_9PEZI|nr:hypothetical protein B0T16DRAFT_333538 [Cercophora newfieldiana]
MSSSSPAAAGQAVGQLSPGFVLFNFCPQTNSSQPPSGPPYIPTVAQLGGQPKPLPDDPITAVLLALFVGSAAMHMTIFQVNRRHSHRFIFSILLFGFSMARITALTMRLVFSQHSTNVSVGIAAGVFTAAGVLLLFLVNLMFAQRIVRAYHPSFGWHNALRWAFRTLYITVGACLIMVITVSIHLFYTSDPVVRQRERNVQLFAGTYLAVLAFLPIPIVLAARAAAWWKVRKETDKKKRLVAEKFGSGSFKAKMTLLLTTSTLLALGAAFRAGTAYVPRPITDPAWYHSRAAYYCFNFVIELIVVYMYGIARFDKRFHVPNGSSKPGDYAKGFGLSVNKEEEVFGTEEGSATVEEKMDEDDTSGVVGHDSGVMAGPEWEERYAYARGQSVILEQAKKSGEAV